MIDSHMLRQLDWSKDLYKENLQRRKIGALHVESKLILKFSQQFNTRLKAE
jgi:hypothetical protein